MPPVPGDPEHAAAPAVEGAVRAGAHTSWVPLGEAVPDEGHHPLEGQVSGGATRESRLVRQQDPVVAIEGVVLSSADRGPVTHARVSLRTATHGVAPVESGVDPLP